MAGITNPIVSTAEVQTVTVDATGGTFTVTWNGATTSALAFNVSAADFTTAMALVADGAGNVTVTGGPGAAGGGTPYTLTWAAGRGNVPAPTTDASSLTGGAGTAAVATTTAGVSALADPWLSVGAHSAPTHPTPDQGDWQWCMMEVAAWMAGESWTDDPANVSPVIAQFCKILNDLFPDADRQGLKTYLAVAPAGVIDTVDGTKETARKYLATNWLVRTYIPLLLDLAGLTDEADLCQALPAIAVGTVDHEETEAVLSAVGTVARAVAEYNWSDQDWHTWPGDGRVDFPIAGDYLEFLWPSLTSDRDFATLELARRCAMGAAWTSTGEDDGQLAWDGARRAARAAAWDVAGLVKPLLWDSTRATPSPWLGITGGVTDEDTVGLAAWNTARDAALAAVTQGRVARETFNVYDVRFAAWLAWLDAEDDPQSGEPFQSAYTAAKSAAETILGTTLASVGTSVLSVLAAMCAA